MSTNLTNMPVAVDDPVAEKRERVRKRLQAQRKFRSDVFAYAVINLFLVGTWLVTGAGYFWPGWVLAGWGVLLVLDGWNVYLRPPITDEDVEAHLRGGRS
jgi:hypothetical protein